MADIETIPSVEEIDAGVPAELEHYEIVDGQVVVMASTSDRHQHVLVELGTEFVLWARERGAVVLSQTFDVRTTRTRRRQPDLMVVLAEPRDRIGHRGMRGAPDLVVEILSPSTRAVDLGPKREEYAGIDVPEYWCIDTDAGQALAAAPPDAPWRILRRVETLTSTALPGFAVPLDRVLPPPPDQ